MQKNENECIKRNANAFFVGAKHHVAQQIKTEDKDIFKKFNFFS